jgi:hypothetical protein
MIPSWGSSEICIGILRSEMKILSIQEVRSGTTVDPIGMFSSLLRRRKIICSYIL